MSNEEIEIKMLNLYQQVEGNREKKELFSNSLKQLMEYLIIADATLQDALDFQSEIRKELRELVSTNQEI